MKKKHLIIALVLYLLSAVGSYSVMTYANPATTNQSTDEETTLDDDEETKLGSLLEIDSSAPKDQICPLNGAYYTLTEKDAWENRRPLFVMIENTPDARPQSGLSKADVVFELIAEGGVTRFGAMFYCAAQAQDVTIAPIRSARTYFVDYASGFYRPLYVHVGGANVPGPTNALGQISDYGWGLENDINQFSVGYPTFVRNYSRLGDKKLATEHTMESSSEKLWAVAEKRGWGNKAPEITNDKIVAGEKWTELYDGWMFEDEASDIGDVKTVSYDFWSGYSDYSVKWIYDSELDKFQRFHGEEELLDLNNDERVAATNVVVIKTTEKGPINEKKHMLYGTTGTGDALIFKHGDVIEANWSKKTRRSQLQFTDNRGEPVEMARGLTWISVIDISNKVEY
ncbi:MAG: DUF3048 domain-containing protein [Patescibacteria group bacterium]|nr:DUF3048 domain-containing protein [Patescibacteria group bacterium]